MELNGKLVFADIDSVAFDRYYDTFWILIDLGIICVNEEGGIYVQVEPACWDARLISILLKR